MLTADVLQSLGGFLFFMNTLPTYSFVQVKGDFTAAPGSQRNIIYYTITNSGCLQVVNRTPTKGGYILVHINGKQEYLHRLSCISAHGVSELHACHKCDNPLCFNPDHLFFGSDADNMGDASKKGRTCFGEKNHRSILTENQAREILLSKEKNVRLSEKYNVHWVTIYDIKKRRTWKHLSAL